MNKEEGATHPGSPGTQQVEIAVLAGGCFWGVEEILRAVPGVIDTDVGYTGGWLENPTYHDTHDSKSGHAEAIRVTFDPAVLSYEDLLEKWFFKLHDPTTLEPPGQRHRDTVPLRDLSAEPRTGGGRRASEGARRGVRQMEAADHDDDRAGLDLVQRRGLPPGLLAEAPGRVYLPLHAGLVSTGAAPAESTRFNSSGRPAPSASLRRARPSNHHKSR